MILFCPTALVCLKLVPGTLLAFPSSKAKTSTQKKCMVVFKYVNVRCEIELDTCTCIKHQISTI